MQLCCAHVDRQGAARTQLSEKFTHDNNRMMKSAVLALTLVLPAAMAHAALSTNTAKPKIAQPQIVIRHGASVEQFRAYALALTSGKYLYTEVHKRHLIQHKWTGGVVDYYAPDGARIGHKVLRFSGRDDVPLYRLELAGTGAARGVNQVTDKNVQLFRQAQGEASPQHATVAHAENMVADITGVERFIQQHFKALLKEPQVVVMASASDLEVDRIKITRLKDGKVQGKSAVRFKLESASLMHLFFGQPQFFSFAPDTHRLLEYRGLSELKNPQTGEPYKVRVYYGGKAPPNAPDLTGLGDAD